MTDEFYRIQRLPPYVFAEVNAMKAAARARGEDIVDLGMGNPDGAPPRHVIDKLAEVAAKPTAHRYSASKGIPGLRKAQAAYYQRRFGVELDPEREVAIVPGIKSTLAEFPLCVVERGSTLLLPDPGYPDYLSGAALADARVLPLPIEPRPDFADAPDDVAAVYLNYPSNPTGLAAGQPALAELRRRLAERPVRPLLPQQHHHRLPARRRPTGRVR